MMGIMWPKEMRSFKDIEGKPLTAGDVGHFVQTSQGYLGFKILFNAILNLGGYSCELQALLATLYQFNVLPFH